MKHTPGPWDIDFDSGEIRAADGQVTIGTIYGVDGYFPCIDEDEDDEGVLEFMAECQANARLITAAPELLAALEGLISGTPGHYYSSSDYHAIEQAVSAIAKAKGK